MTTPKETPTAKPDAAPGLRAWLKPLPALRAALSRHRWLTPLLAVIPLAILAVVAATILGKARKVVVESVEPREERVTLAMALEALDGEYYGHARELAAKLRRQKLQPQETGGPSFVLGAAAAYEADDLWGQEQRNYYLLAARHLEQARKAGFPPQRDGEGLFLLGKSLALTGKSAEARPLLEETLTTDNPFHTATHRLLTNLYLEGPKPDLPKALEHNTQYLADKDLDLDQRKTGSLGQAQIQWKLDDLDGCLKTLDEMPAEAKEAAEANLLRGQLLLRRAQALKEKLATSGSSESRAQVVAAYEQAIKVLRTAQDDPLDSVSIRRSMYLIGVCLLELEDQRAALAQFTRARSVYLDTPEGLAAGLQEADLLRALSRDDDAVASYRRTLGAVPADQSVANPWIPLTEFRARVIEAIEHYSKTDQYPKAIAIAERAAALMSEEASVRLTADAHRAWGKKLLLESAAAAEPEAKNLRTLGRKRSRQAGRLFSRLAKLEFTSRRYPDDLWEAADCYLEGHSFTSAVGVLEEYLKHELRRRRPLALVNLGEALLALNRLDDALEVLQECLAYHPQDPACYDARLLASKVYLEKNQTDEAEAILRGNLSGELLTPDSREWRESLFAYSKLLATGGRYDEAIARMEEAISRYPEARETLELRYLVAEAYRQVSKVPQEKLRTDTIETARLAHFKQIQQALEAAIVHYEKLQAALNRRQEKAELSPIENATLRNSYFAVGSALFDMGRYEESIRAYSTATNRYQHTPEVLDAFVQIATCYRRLNKPVEARGAVEQAKVVLSRIKEDANFTSATNYTRGEWSSLLDWLGTL